MKKIMLLLLTIILVNGCTEQIACTEEAKLCPDGSAVGRTGPNCEFAPCPNECNVDADCVPATCCHPDMCVPTAQEPRCAGIVCTAECVPGTMDCGQGQCECTEGACTAVIN